MKPGGQCPVEKLEWIDNNGVQVYIDCFDSQGKSKGLRIIANELGLNLNHLKLEDLKKELLKHPAFDGTSKLEVLAKKYGIKIIFCPKFHCELNPIEGLWLSQKHFIRSKTDQTFEKMKSLYLDSRLNYIESNLNIKLIRRFWRTLNAYSKGVTYADVLFTYFSGKSKEKIQNHRQISNKNIL